MSMNRAAQGRKRPIGGGDLTRLAIGIIGIGTSGPLIALLTLPFALAKGEWRSLTRKSWSWSILAGVFLALHFICFFYSMRLTSVASGTALTATQPIFVALWLRYKGRVVDRRVWVGMAISMVGVLIITGVDWSLSTR